jgi:hypothetical protein
VHVLTKIFIVLVSLLAVLLVPLVVVYAHNEDSFKARFEAATAQVDAANAALKSAEGAHARAIQQLQSQIDQLSNEKADVSRTANDMESRALELQTQLTEARGMQANIVSKLNTLVASVDAGQKLNESLVDEVRQMRSDLVAAEKRSIELDEALRDATARLDVAIEARRALQEELQRVKEELTQALGTAQQYRAQVGPLREMSATALSSGIVPTVSLDARVLNVRRSSNETLAEINVGERDGVKRDWVLLIADGGTFVANLRIINVDVDRSTGIVTLEDQANPVREGQRAIARPLGQ